MKNKYLLLFFCLCVWSVQALRAVEVISLDRGWKFHRGYESVGEELTVDLPHTWNKGDVMFAGSDYYRGMCIYSRPLSVPASWAGRRVFLRVEAAQTVAEGLEAATAWAQENQGTALVCGSLFLVGEVLALGEGVEGPDPSEGFRAR